MLPILIPTDFSDVANNAVHFGCSMAIDQNNSVVLLHAFMMPVNINEDPMMIMPLNEGQEIAEGRFDAFTERLRKEYPQLKIESVFMMGDLHDCIDDYASENPISIVVMGNSGEGSTMLWLGSNVTSVMKHVKQFVLAVPSKISYARPLKIGFACDFKSHKNHEQLEQLADWIQILGAELHVVNVNDNNKDVSPESIYEDSIVHQALMKVKPEYHLLQGQNADEVINGFVNTHNMDWLVIAPHHHSFFERIFHKSHTTTLIQHCAVPLLAIHEL